MTTVAVLWGPFEREVLEAVSPDLLLATPADLIDLPQTQSSRVRSARQQKPLSSSVALWLEQNL